MTRLNTSFPDHGKSRSLIPIHPLMSHPPMNLAVISPASTSSSGGKIAFLFLTIADLRMPDLWTKFFRAAPPNSFSIYNHAKYGDRIASTSPLRGRHTRVHIATQWATNSLVRATIIMLQEALEDPENAYFVLCSDSCIPIVDFDTVQHFLWTENTSFFCFNPNYPGTKDCQKRYTRFGDKRWIPMERFWKADQWFILNRQGAVVCVQNQNRASDFEKVFASDEHFFINVMSKTNTPFRNRWTTFTDYEHDRSHPIEFRELHPGFLRKLQHSGFFFLRKVAPGLRLLPEP